MPPASPADADRARTEVRDEQLKENVEKLNKKAQELVAEIKKSAPQILDQTPMGRISKDVVFYAKDGKIYCRTSANDDVARVNQAIGYKLDPNTKTLVRGNRTIAQSNGAYEIPIDALFETGHLKSATQKAEFVMQQMERQQRMVLPSHSWQDDAAIDSSDAIKAFDTDHQVADATDRPGEAPTADEALQKQVAEIKSGFPRSMTDSHDGLSTFFQSLKVTRGKDGTMYIESSGNRMIRHLFTFRIATEALGLEKNTKVVRVRDAKGAIVTNRVTIPGNDAGEKLKKLFDWVGAAYTEKKATVPDQPKPAGQSAPSSAPNSPQEQTGELPATAPVAPSLAQEGQKPISGFVGNVQKDLRK